MSFRSRLNRRVSIHRFVEGESVDIYNAPITTTVTVENVPASFNWSSTLEDNQDRETQSTKALLIVGPEIEIGPNDEVTVGETTFKVDGTPDEVWNHHGVHHIVVPLRVHQG